MKASNFRKIQTALLIAMIPSVSSFANTDGPQKKPADPTTGGPAAGAPTGGAPKVAAKTADTKAPVDPKAADPTKAPVDPKVADKAPPADTTKVADPTKTADPKTADVAPPAPTEAPTMVDLDQKMAAQYFMNFAITCVDKQSDGSCNRAQLGGYTFKKCVPPSDPTQFELSNSATSKELVSGNSRGFHIALLSTAQSCLDAMKGQKCSAQNPCVRISELNQAASSLDLKALNFDGTVALLNPMHVGTPDDYSADPAVPALTVKSAATVAAELKAKKDKDFQDTVDTDKKIVAYCSPDRARDALKALVKLGQVTAADVDAAVKVIDKRELEGKSGLLEAFNKAKVGEDDAEMAALLAFAGDHPDFASEIAKAIMAKFDKVALGTTDFTAEDHYMDALTTLAGQYPDVVADVAKDFGARVDLYNKAAKANGDPVNGQKMIARATAIINRTEELDINSSTKATLESWKNNDLKDTMQTLLAYKGYSNNPDFKTLTAERQSSACSEMQKSCDQATISQATQMGLCQQSRSMFFVSFNGQSNKKTDPDACTRSTSTLSKIQSDTQGAVAIDCMGMQQQGSYPNYQSYAQCQQVLAKYSGQQQQGQQQYGGPVGANGQPLGQNGQPQTGVYNAQAQGPGSQGPGARFGSAPVRTTQSSAAFGPQMPGVDLSQTWGAGASANPQMMRMPSSVGSPFQQ